MEKYIRPEFLKKGDTVAVMAVASCLNERARTAGMMPSDWREVIESFGLNIKVGKHLFDVKPGEFAGTDRERADDLEAMLKDDDVKAIISFRGGYGTMRTINTMDLNLFKEHPKWVVGYSDITVLHTALQKMGIESILGAMPCSFGENGDPDAELTRKWLREALFGETIRYDMNPHPFSKFGKARGRLVGGNLSLFMSTLTTPWENHIDEDCVLFLEDIEERMLSVDRMFLTLKMGGYLDRAKAIVIGQFTDTAHEDLWERNVYELIKEYTDQLNVPVLFGCPCGHEYPNQSLYLGREVEVEVDADGGHLIFQ